MESRIETQSILDPPAAPEADLSVTRIPYHGWPDAILISNGSIEAIVVPAIGRVMQLRLAGEAEGAFWANRALDGKLHPAECKEWVNFGGDKCWPAPQSAWPQHQGHDWPPPAAFDSSPVEATVSARGVILSSPIDPCFGIQVIRHVQLDPNLPVMRIKTEYRKILGSPVSVSVWSITQMCNPERMFIPLHRESKMAGGFVHLIDMEPKDLHIEGGLLSLARHPIQTTKIGVDATSMAWIGRKLAVRIDAEAGPGEFPDGGCLTEIYTNPDPLPYVELETLGPMATMSAGDKIERTTIYTILPRSESDAEAEAHKILAC